MALIGKIGDQLTGEDAFTKVTLDSIYKNANLVITNSTVILADSVLYTISYNVWLQSTSSSPECQARIAVVSGDSTWGIETISNTKVEVGAAGNGSVNEFDCLQMTVQFRPSSTTVIQLEVITRFNSQNGKVINANLCVTGEKYFPIT